jgi:Family of unknown function (DUF6600)
MAAYYDHGRGDCAYRRRRYQYPNSYDGRYNDYDAYLSDPYYYDPYRQNASYQYASSTIPGINDLDYYGDWQNVTGYGNAWRPRVDSGWVPYQQGQWTNDYPYGPTWVSSEPWGYAPYHSWIDQKLLEADAPPQRKALFTCPPEEKLKTVRRMINYFENEENN